MSARLELVPINLRDANAFVGVEHRHCDPVVGHKFALGCRADGKLCGVVIVGRTTARGIHTSLTAEVTRLATDGTWNSCSFLYARAKRVVQAMGYTSLKTYTRVDESGGSLRAIAACCEAELKARSWAQSSKKRPRKDKSQPVRRLRHELLQVAS
jgi:hypothetical protein